jgi:ribulose-phosphate 3-epimerase
MFIIPSLVEKTPEDLFVVIEKISPYYRQFQVDVEDGKYVPNKTLSVTDLHTYLLNNAPPENLIFDFHLMVKDYENEVENISSLKNVITIQSVLIHASFLPDYQAFVKKYPSFAFGLVINPEEDVDLIASRYDLKRVPVIQIMTVNPGPQEQPFIPDALQKIEQLRMAGFRNKIYLDGAINERTMPTINSLKFKPDVLCPGSFLTKTGALEEHVDFLTLLPSRPTPVSRHY